MASFEERLNSPESYIIQGYIDGNGNKKRILNNKAYNTGYEEGLSDYKYQQSVHAYLDKKVLSVESMLESKL